MTDVGDDWMYLAVERAAMCHQHFNECQKGGNPIFGCDFLRGKYADTIKTQMIEFEKSYLQTFSSLDGYQLIGKRRIKLEFSDSLEVNAWVSPPSTNSFTTITITLGMILCLDVLSAWAVFYQFGDYSPDIKIPNVDEEFAGILYGVAAGIGVSSIKESYRLIQSQNSEAIEAWAKNTSLSLYWVLSHELGHYACGHVGYDVYTRSQNDPTFPKIQELVDQEMAKDKRLAHIEIDKGLISWCAELQADSYATIQLLMHLTSSKRESGLYHAYNDIDRANDLGAVCRRAHLYSFVPSLVVHSGRLFGRESRELSSSTHPKALTRQFNIAATIDFFMRPISNAALDVRASLAFEYVNIDKGPPPGRNRFFQCLMKVYEAHWKTSSWTHGVFEIAKFRAVKSVTSPPEAKFRMAMKHTKSWMQNVFIARQGITRWDCDDFESNEYNSAIDDWSLIFRVLCTNVNGRFSWFMPKNWTSKPGENQGMRMHPEYRTALGISNMTQEIEMLELRNRSGKYVNDPTYKILDDWMSNVQHCAQQMTDEELAPYVAQELSIAGSVDSDIWKATTMAKPDERIF